MEISEQDEIEMGFCSECRKYKPACTCPGCRTPGHIAAGIICENLSEFISGYNETATKAPVSPKLSDSERARAMGRTAGRVDLR